MQQLLDGETNHSAQNNRWRKYLNCSRCSGRIDSVFGAKRTRRRKISILILAIASLFLFVMGVGISIFVDAFGPENKDVESGNSSEVVMGPPLPNKFPTKPPAPFVPLPTKPDDTSYFTFGTPSKKPAASSVITNLATPSYSPTTIDSVSGDNSPKTTIPTVSLRPTSINAINSNMPNMAPSISDVTSTPTISLIIAYPTLSPEVYPDSLNQGSPTGAPTTLSEPSDTPSLANTSSARLSGNCFVVAVDDTPDITASSYNDIVIPYEYTLITSSSSSSLQDIQMLVTQLENELHDLLMADVKCRGSTMGRREMQGGIRQVLRGAQVTYQYQGFNSNPPDEVSKDCTNNTSELPLEEGQECHLISGGVTAVVESAAEEGTIRSETGSFVKDVLTDPVNYQSLSGVQQVVFGSEVIPSVTPTTLESPSSIYDQTSLPGVVSHAMSSASVSPSTNSEPDAAGVAAPIPSSVPSLSLVPSHVPSLDSTPVPSSMLSSFSLSMNNVDNTTDDVGARTKSPSMIPSVSTSPSTRISADSSGIDFSTTNNGTKITPTSSPGPSSIPSLISGTNSTPMPSSSHLPTTTTTNATVTSNKTTVDITLPVLSFANATDDTVISTAFAATTNSSSNESDSVYDALSAPYIMTLSMEGQSNFSHFGFSLAMSSDGSIVAVGAKDAQNELGVATGALYLYSLKQADSSSLTLLHVLYGRSYNSEFANAVALSNNGNRLVIGSRSESGQAGATYIYQRDEAISSNVTTLITSSTPTWSFMEGGVISGQTPSGEAGWAVSISGDGNGEKVYVVTVA